MITDRDRVLLHTLGLTRSHLAYRNHYVAGEGHHSMHHLRALVADGLMEQRTAPGFLAQGDQVFAATDKGKAYAYQVKAHNTPKLTRSQKRYRRWLEEDSEQSFGDWLRSGASR